MRRIATAPEAERSEVFESTAFDTGLNVALVEKDFWVTYLLDTLFRKSPYRDDIVFKGGTSLSKGFGLIQRFSEDIDLILDWRLLGYGLKEPWEERSNNKQEKFKLDSIERTNAFLRDKFAPAVRELVSDDLGIDADIYAGEDEETVVFAYPKIFHSDALLDVVKLEIGPMAAWSPSECIEISSYCSQENPGIFERTATSVRTVRPERTFWEKATILHQEAHRPESKAMPKRYSRHYYDLHQLANSFVMDAALGNAELLARVVAFKEKFYRTPWAKLPDAKTGTLKLAPPEYRMKELSRDYDSMQPMIYGERPSFDELMESMRQIERSINER